MREHYPELRERVLTIHNGVDTEGFAPGAREQDAQARRSQLGIAPERLVAAFVGSEWERKGLEPADPRARLGARLGCSSSRAPATALRYQRARRLARRRRRRALARGDTATWQLVYALADAFVLPSSYETFSLVTFEAAASGLPLLATPVNGVRELIDDGRNGFLIDREPQHDRGAPERARRAIRRAARAPRRARARVRARLRLGADGRQARAALRAPACRAEGLSTRPRARPAST